ncbi:MAG: DUF2281 domain-containing protein [Bacteroidota bacterium]
MFEMTLRTDDKKAFYKLMDFAASLDLKVLKSPVFSGKKITVEFEESPFQEEKAAPYEVPANSADLEKEPTPFPTQRNEPPENIKSGFGCMKGMFWMSDDFDDPLDEFIEYMY